MRTNLMAGKRGKEIIAPVLDEETTAALWFNKCMEEHLCQELRLKSTIIIVDNARFHIKEEVNRITNYNGHEVIFLPPSSPDLNPIEKVFAILKKKRCFAAKGTTIDQIIKSYGLFLE